MPDCAAAERVLLSVLDCQPVEVSAIREALDGLHQPESNYIQTRILKLELVAAQAAKVVAAHDGYGDVFKNIAALKPLLAEVRGG